MENMPELDTEEPSDAVPPAIWAHCPRVREMSRRQIECVLSRNYVARVAFQTGFRLELRPVHYVYSGGTFFLRSSFETKTPWIFNPEVVVEIDEVDGLFDWRSVIARGKVSLVRARGSLPERAAYWSAVDTLRTLVPSAFGECDPTPYRSAVFRVDPHEMTGRETRGK